MNFKQILSVIPKLVKYNLKIIFAGKFIWFFLASFLFFLFFMWSGVRAGMVEINEAYVFSTLLMPGILLVFYPAVFGIQNDEDNKILEILFGVPNYRYKVWLLRLAMIYVAVFVILLIYSYMSYFLLYPVNSFEMVSRLMLPIMFIGNFAFLLSTITRNGNSTAVVLIIISVAFVALSGSIGNSMWNVILNPFEMPENMHPVIWDKLLFRNTMFLLIGGLVVLMLGLQNLQKREKFI